MSRIPVGEWIERMKRGAFVSRIPASDWMERMKLITSGHLPAPTTPSPSAPKAPPKPNSIWHKPSEEPERKEQKETLCLLTNGDAVTLRPTFNGNWINYEGWDVFDKTWNDTGEVLAWAYVDDLVKQAREAVG